MAEKVDGKTKSYPVDGFCESCLTVYQYHGAWHGKDCCIKGLKKTPEELLELKKKWKKTEEIEQKILNLGFKLKTTCGCNRRVSYPKRRFYTGLQLLEAVRDDKFFGILAVSAFNGFSNQS